MTLYEWREMIYQEVNEKIDRDMNKNFFARFYSLGKWAQKFESSDNKKEFLQNRFVLTDIRKMKRLIEESTARIEYLNAHRYKHEESYENLIKLLQSANSTTLDKQRAIKKYQTEIINICMEYYIFTFLSAMLMAARYPEKYSTNPAKVESVDPFSSRIYGFFYFRKGHSSNTSIAISVSKLFDAFETHEDENLNHKIMYYIKFYHESIWEMFDSEWKSKMVRLSELIPDNLYPKKLKNSYADLFLTVVDKQYPYLDTEYHGPSHKDHPMEIFMRRNIVEDRVAMLFTVLKSKGKDGYVGDYIRGILLELKNHIKTMEGNTAKISSYIQLLYQNCVDDCVRSKSTYLMDAFNECFDINTYVKEPWSPLFNLNGCYEEIIKFNIEHEVSFNKEGSIFGRLACRNPGPAILGYKTKADLMDYLVSKGMVIEDGSFYYMAAIEQHNTILLNWLCKNVDPSTDDDFPIRCAMYETSRSMCYAIMDAYTDKEDCIMAIKEIANLSCGDSGQINFAKSLLKEMHIEAPPMSATKKDPAVQRHQKDHTNLSNSKKKSSKDTEVEIQRRRKEVK